MTEARDTAGFQFTNEDYEELTDAVARMAVSDHLPKEQWGLLLSIFAAAARRLEVEDKGQGIKEGNFREVKVDGREIEDPRNKDVKTLREQLRKAHMPRATPPSDSIGFMISPQRPPAPTPTPTPTPPKK